MKKMSAVVLSASIVFFSGCLYCFNPPYAPEDIIEEPKLVGEWQDQGGCQCNYWTIRSVGEKSYEVTLKYGEDAPQTYSARVFRLKDDIYLDFFPKETEGQGTLFDRQLAPFHLIMKLRWREEGFETVQLNVDWLDKARKEKRIKLKTVKIEGGAEILTASRAEGRELLLKFGEEAFSSGQDVFNVETFGPAKLLDAPAASSPSADSQKTD